MTMKIGAIGAGKMCEALVGHWIEAGHEAMISGRSPERTAAAAARIGARAGTPREAVAFGDVVLFAVRYQDADAALAAAGAAQGALEGKVVVDCTNPVETGNFTLVPFGGGSLAAHIAARTGAHVVKAFHLAEARVWRELPTFAGRPLVVPMAGADRAKRVGAELVAALGYRHVDTGGIEHAGLLEATAAIVIRRVWGGADPTTTVLLDAV